MENVSSISKFLILREINEFFASLVYLDSVEKNQLFS